MGGVLGEGERVGRREEAKGKKISQDILGKRWSEVKITWKMKETVELWERRVRIQRE
jgi:hypothetical protein